MYSMQYAHGTCEVVSRTHVGLREVAVEGGGVELGEAVDLDDVGVYAVGDGDVDQAVVGAQGHRRLGALLCQRVQPRPGAAAQDDAQHGLRKRPDAQTPALHDKICNLLIRIRTPITVPSEL